jgi:excinuclease UvrABC nuclease subunit
MEKCWLMGPGFLDMSVLLDSGIYVLLDRGRVVYIGQSKLMLRRMYEHALAKGKLARWAPGRGKVRFRFDEVFVRPCQIHELDRLEAELIAQYAPKYNLIPKAGAPMPEVIREMIAAVPPAELGFSRRGL